MAPKLTIKTPPFYPLEPSLSSPPRTPFPRPSAYTRKSELQKKLNAIVKRVIGESPDAPSSPDSLASSDADFDDRSEYGEDPPPPPHHTQEASISGPSSYASLAALNPYSTAPEDVGQHLSLFSPPPSPNPHGQWDRHAQDEAWLAREFDCAHAAVVAEEDAALKILREQTQLG
ncbi:hypothetical protein GQX73_g6550 [Xylaria multiplex]|uniref:Uncharacterized protein n=1 Tax=Xylaria multiplex TaxID=323545 RepID=A0A7C8N2Y8_9PEZI|nr:hypothetical protein GQX73_g6550 [Xylaria multiplex]